MILYGCDTVFRNRGFYHIEVETEWSNMSSGRTTLYLKDTVNILGEQLYDSDKTVDFIFRTVYSKAREDGSAFQFSRMQTANFQDIYKYIITILFLHRTIILSVTTLKIQLVSRNRSQQRAFCGCSN